MTRTTQQRKKRKCKAAISVQALHNLQEQVRSRENKWNNRTVHL